MEDVLTINGKRYALVGVQREGVSAVYRGEGSYLRIGEPQKIERDLAFHKRMEAAGFPVARLLAEGVHEGMTYFVESSLGERRLGLAFGDAYEKSGRIEDMHFAQLIEVVKRHLSAQCSAPVNRAWDAFAEGIQLPQLILELPDHEAAIRARFKEVTERLSHLPFVITHGDLNAQNIYATGVIDLEDSFVAPLGYDAMTVLVHLDAFPDSHEFEFFAKYRFTEEQKKQYRESIDAHLQQIGQPTVSALEEEFAFCRTVWSSVRMHEWPKLQTWRYNMFIERFLKSQKRVQ